MTVLAPAIKGWCPGALSPMPTGDGLLARVRLSAGRLSFDQARGVANCARDCGNGAIELTSRANLQLRGISPGALPELQGRLSRLGLLDDDPAVERVRNIVASPLADLDPTAVFDVSPAVAALEARISRDPDLRALPAKFGFAIDGGGRWPLGDVEADVRFEATDAGFVAMLGEIRPSHILSLPETSGDGVSVGLTLRHDSLPEIASRLASAFLSLAGRGSDAPRRMRALTNRIGAAGVFAAANLTPDAVQTPPRATFPREVIGPLAFPSWTALGVAPVFGRMDASAFDALVNAARSRGASSLRLTPWRALIAIGLDAARAGQLAGDLAALGFVTTATDPRLGVVACPGAPACAHAMSDAPADALALASALGGRGGVVLHVSGCAKGCARAAPSPITLTATPLGYDLILNGRAGDAPARRGLTLSDARGLAA